MKQILTEQERIRLDQRVAEAEKRTGLQIVLAVTGRSDSYAELPWKAFALGTAVSGLGAVLFSLLLPGRHPGSAVLLVSVSMLATGAVCALLCVVVPGFARLFLDAHRAETEVLQYAQSLFLSREVFATQGRSGLLLLISMFERKVVLLPDTGLSSRLPGPAVQDIIARVTATLAAGPVYPALEKGLGALEETLADSSPGTTGKDELPNVVVEENGS